MSDEQPITKLGSDWNEERSERVRGRPVILEAQDVPFIRLQSPEEIKQWEKDVMAQFGISVDVAALAGGSGGSGGGGGGGPTITCECGCVGAGGRFVSDRTDLEQVV
jgi:hypothetical protein